MMKGEHLEIGVKTSLWKTDETPLVVTYKYRKNEIEGSAIHGFTYGGLNTRFWMLKNAINLLPKEKIVDQMLSWNMITIQYRGEK